MSEFVDALHEGIVEFEYTKVSGEARPARGTLCKKFMPPEIPMKYFIANDIEWDMSTAAPGTKKPIRRYKLAIEAEKVEAGTTPLKTLITEALKSRKGVTPLSFTIEEALPPPPQEVKPGLVRYFDLDKNEFRCFYEDALKTWVAVA